MIGRATSGPQGAQAEDPRSIRDDRHAIVFRGEPVHFGGVFRDGLADPGHSWRVDHREHLLICNRDFALNADFASLVHQNGPIGSGQHLYVRHRGEARQYSFAVLLGQDIEGDLAHHGVR